MAVMMGDKKGAGGGKVLRSTIEDNVFLFFVDHGAPGILAFPGPDEKHRPHGLPSLAPGTVCTLARLRQGCYGTAPIWLAMDQRDMAGSFGPTHSELPSWG